MSASASSSAGKRPRKKAASVGMSLPPLPSAAVGSLPLAAGTLPLVPCPCCRVHRTIRLVSQSDANPGRIFYKCPNHRISPNPCNHYYWEDGEDNYGDFLVANGYINPASGSVVYAGGIAPAETDDAEEEHGVKMDDVVKKLDLVVKKMDDVAEIGRNILAAILVLIAVLLYLVVAK